MKKTLILFVIFLTLGAFVYFYEYRGGQTREKAEKIRNSLLKTGIEEIESVTLIRGDGDTITYVRKDNDKWRITSPVSADAEKSAVRSNMATFTNAKIKRRLVTSRDNVRNFGLNPPAAEVVITSHDTVEWHLLIGDKAVTRGDLFVALAGESSGGDSLEVLVTATNVLDQARKSLFDLRDKKIAHFNTEDVLRVEISSREAPVVLEKSGSNWEMMAPRNLPVDGSRVKNFLSSLANYSAKEFVQEQFEDGTPFGFNDPTVRISLSLGEERSTKEIVVGKALQGEKSFYAFESGRSPVLAIRESAMKALSKSPFYFQDKKIVKFAENELTEMRFSGAHQLRLVREDTLGWYAYGDSVIKVESSRMTRLFSHLRSLTAKELVTYEPGDLSRYGLEVPFLAVVMVDGEGEKTGFSVGDGVDKDRYVKSMPLPYVYLIPVSQVERVTTWLDALSDKS